MNQTTGSETEASSTAASPNLMSSLAQFSLGMWGLYFIAKLALYWAELIGFHAWQNLAFAAFIMVPVKHVTGRKVKRLATVLFAVALLYYDSWLPSIGRVWSQASLLSGFSSTYLIELAGRFINPSIVAMLVGTLALYWFVSRWIRMNTIVIGVMAVMAITTFIQKPAPHAPEQNYPPNNPYAEKRSDNPAQSAQLTKSDQPPVKPELPSAQAWHPLQPAPSVQGSEPVEDNIADHAAPDMDKVLERFFAQEATRSVFFPAPKVSDLPFDVIFIHVCSLSWDDLRAVGLEHHPLWQRFDILLTHFNSASTYSGPAAIRIQRATCGQTSHAKLYTPAAEKCYLMDSLKRSGFEPALAMNHDGHFDNFLKLVQAQGQLNIAPFSLDGAAITQHAFDDTPIYNDLSVLNRWLEHRQKSNSPRVALYYNTISLHDGNHLAGTGANLNSRENYKIRLTNLLDDLEKFMQNLEKSGRRAVVAMIPEHGAALRGDKMQIAGLREIPSPSITLVPVGIKVIGANLQREGKTLSIDKPTSYMAVSHIVAHLLEKPPYNKNAFTPSDYVADLPVTPFVAQNENVVMAGFKGRYYLRQDESGWIDYTDF